MTTTHTANAHEAIAAKQDLPQSVSVGVHCGDCGALLGDQFKPGDGFALFRAHMPVCPAEDSGHLER